MPTAEKSLLLTQEEYEALYREWFETSTGYQQKDYYYDTDELSMNAQSVICRIRERNRVHIATRLKAAGEGPPESRAIITKGISDWFPLSQQPLSLKGCLTTQRRAWYAPESTTVFLDKNHYMDVTDYEVTIAYPQGQEDSAHAGIQNIAQRLYRYGLIDSVEGWALRFSHTPRKSQRFFDRWKQLHTAQEEIP